MFQQWAGVGFGVGVEVLLGRSWEISRTGISHFLHFLWLFFSAIYLQVDLGFTSLDFASVRFDQKRKESASQ